LLIARPYYSMFSLLKQKHHNKGRPRMFILHDILEKLKKEFDHSRKGKERGTWFIYTLVAIIIPFTSSKTSNLFRCLKGLFGFTDIRKKRYYTFMASPKIPCLPLSYRFYHLKKSIEKRKQARSKPEIEFETKIEQAVNMITDIAEAFNHTRIMVTTDSWFGNNGLWKPLHKKLGQWFHMTSRLRSNNNIFDLPGSCTKRGPGRPKKIW